MKDFTSISTNGLYDWKGYTAVRGMVWDHTSDTTNDHFQTVRYREAKVGELPLYWAVLVQQNEGEDETAETSNSNWECIAEFNTEAQATDFQDLLQTILTLDLPRPN